ncbi:cold-shock protein [Roseateles sp. LYH14W]|uniref:Cold-shock protein n=2 Tax=Pelomonas parva TaxID=3299032 RepID=A0ABW7F1Z5_9BURK
MRFEGILSAWNPDAGYGTIRALNGGDELFVSLGAFPMDGEGPRLDEPFSFEVVSGRDGRKQAVNLKRLPRAAPPAVLREATAGARARTRQMQRKRRLGLAAGAVVAVMLVAGGMRWWQPDGTAAEVPAALRR